LSLSLSFCLSLKCTTPPVVRFCLEQLEIRLATLKEQLVCCGHEVEKSHDEFVRLLSVYNEMVAQLSLAFLRWNKVLDVRLAGNAE